MAPTIQITTGTISPKRKGTATSMSSMPASPSPKSPRKRRDTGRFTDMPTDKAGTPKKKVTHTLRWGHRYIREPSIRDQIKNREPETFINGMNQHMKHKHDNDLQPPPATHNRAIRQRNFPALPFAVDNVHFADNKDALTNISMEFIDFLDSLRDLLRLTINCKTKFLTSANPLPNDVMREIHYLPKDKTSGQKTKAFDRELTDALKSGKNELNAKFVPEAQVTLIHKALRKVHVPKKEAKLLGPDQFFGKKSKLPIWQVVGNRTSRERVIDDKEIEREMILKIKKSKTKVPKAGTSLQKVNQLDESITKARSQNIEASSARFNFQMDLLQCYTAGFTSIQDWKLHIKSCRPHWLKDLFVEAVDLEVIVSDQVYEAFEKFGDFYDYNFLALPYPKAKLCLILQSLPIWDASRVTIQRAAAFILRNILLSKNADDELTEWLQARQLTNLVKPQMSYLSREKEKQNDEKEAHFLLESKTDVTRSSIDTDVIEEGEDKDAVKGRKSTFTSTHSSRGIYEQLPRGPTVAVRGASFLGFDTNASNRNSNSLNSKPVLPRIIINSKKPAWK